MYQHPYSTYSNLYVRCSNICVMYVHLRVIHVNVYFVYANFDVCQRTRNELNSICYVVTHLGDVCTLIFDVSKLNGLTLISDVAEHICDVVKHIFHTFIRIRSVCTLRCHVFEPTF